jgi:hypothetical protein
MAGDKPTRKIRAKAIMVDLKAGMPDSQLMSKYGISFQALHDLFDKLIQAGLATESYFDKRATKQTGKPKEKTLTCPYCGFTGDAPFRECPRCHQDVSEWLDTMELTNILTGSFGD